jgi:hypothetical protein
LASSCSSRANRFDRTRTQDPTDIGVPGSDEDTGIGRRGTGVFRFRPGTIETGVPFSLDLAAYNHLSNHVIISAVILSVVSCPTPATLICPSIADAIDVVNPPMEVPA